MKKKNRTIKRERYAKEEEKVVTIQAPSRTDFRMRRRLKTREAGSEAKTVSNIMGAISNNTQVYI